MQCAVTHPSSERVDALGVNRFVVKNKEPLQLGVLTAQILQIDETVLFSSATRYSEV